MAIIYSYPQINLSSISADDLMIISDMNADGRPTKSLTLKNLADFVTSTGTGTGTTNALFVFQVFHFHFQLPGRFHQGSLLIDFQSPLI